jgi:hypothetical protein
MKTATPDFVLKVRKRRKKRNKSCFKIVLEFRNKTAFAFNEKKGEKIGFQVIPVAKKV